MDVDVCSPDGKGLHLINSNLIGGQHLGIWEKFMTSMSYHVSLRNSPTLVKVTPSSWPCTMQVKNRVMGKRKRLYTLKCPLKQEAGSDPDKNSM